MTSIGRWAEVHAHGTNLRAMINTKRLLAIHDVPIDLKDEGIGAVIVLNEGTKIITVESYEEIMGMIAETQ